MDNASISPDELISLCAVDNELFSRTFFAKTARQPAALFHPAIWKLIESNARLVNIQVTRDGAKTSLLRMYTAKRIAYGLANTILFIGKSEGHAARSGRWLRSQIEFNKPFARTFDVRPGKKWQDTEFEIWHGVEDYPIWVLCMGITGGVRGINFDDFRPDLIVADDVIDPENASTPEQRTKIENLILSDLKNSLAPASEAPDAKLVMLQTPLNKEDASCKALDDPEWTSAKFGIWTESTRHLPLMQQESAWPARYPSEVLRKEKSLAIQRNKLSLWLREKECELTSPETSAFLPGWVKIYDLAPEHLEIVLVLDPVPPPTDRQIAQGLRNKDYEAFAVVGKSRGDFFVLETSVKRGHDPDWTITEFFRLCIKYHPRLVIVETVGYQKTLSWLIKKAMTERRKYFVIKEVDDKRNKYQVIVDALSGVASAGHLYFRAEQGSLLSQFEMYPDVSHDDELETVARGVEELSGNMFDLDENEWSEIVVEEEARYPDQVYGELAP